MYRWFNDSNHVGMVGIPAIDGEWGYDEDALNPIFGDGFYLYGEQNS